MDCLSFLCMCWLVGCEEERGGQHQCGEACLQRHAACTRFAYLQAESTKITTYSHLLSWKLAQRAVWIGHCSACDEDVRRRQLVSRSTASEAEIKCEDTSFRIIHTNLPHLRERVRYCAAGSRCCLSQSFSVSLVKTLLLPHALPSHARGTNELKNVNNVNLQHCERYPANDFVRAQRDRRHESHPVELKLDALVLLHVRYAVDRTRRLNLVLYILQLLCFCVVLLPMCRAMQLTMAAIACSIPQAGPCLRHAQKHKVKLDTVSCSLICLSSISRCCLCSACVQSREVQFSTSCIGKPEPQGRVWWGRCLGGCQPRKP